MGRCKSIMLKWKYSDADTICDCGEQTQTMDHLLKCPMLPQECTNEEEAGRTELRKHSLFGYRSAGNWPCREWAAFVSCFFSFPL